MRTVVRLGQGSPFIYIGIGVSCREAPGESVNSSVAEPEPFRGQVWLPKRPTRHKLLLQLVHTLTHSSLRVTLSV